MNYMLCRRTRSNRKIHSDLKQAAVAVFAGRYGGQIKQPSNRLRSTLSADERKRCAAEKAEADPKRVSGTAPHPPRFPFAALFLRLVFCRPFASSVLPYLACAWLRRPRAQRAGDGAASAAPSALPPTCIKPRARPIGTTITLYL